MSKRNKIICGVISSICAVAVICWGVIYSENKEVSTSGTNSGETTEFEQGEVKEIEKPTEDSLNINSIPGFSNIPAKTSALVIESTGAIEFSKDNTYEFVDSMYASISDVSLMEDKIEVNGGDNEITIKNISGEDLGTVYVYYKYIQEGGAYLGGITYRTKFENVTAGAEISEKTSHYSKTTSEILMVDYIK